MKSVKCKFCNTVLEHKFANLGMTPISNSYIKPECIQSKENFYPLYAYVCSNCMLVQLEEFESHKEIFSDEYAYFSSFSDTWLAHCKNYVDKISQQLKLDRNSRVVELASNDGYLLQYFIPKNIPVLGIEPSLSVAKIAEQKGIRTINKFFGVNLAKELSNNNEKADLIIGNNVLAHVPDLNDFVGGMKILLNQGGTITIEFPHLLNLIKYNQFDTIYHEHFSYFSLLTVQKVFAHHGLTLYNVEEIPTHGGSLRIYACHNTDTTKQISANVQNIIDKEVLFGLNDIKIYQRFAKKVKETKRKLLNLLIQIKDEGKTIVGYGAPAKGNTLLNYCGIGTDFIDYTVDRSPYKQGLYLPGTHIPIESPDKIRDTKPDYVIILPWNIKDEILEQMSFIVEWGGKFIVPIPEVEIINPEMTLAKVL